MKALTLHQPWASLIADGRKPFETRSWAPPRSLIGRRIAIHAGRTVDPDAADQFGYARRVIGRTAEGKHPVTAYPFKVGEVICTAMLRGAYRVNSHETYATLKFDDNTSETYWGCGEHMGPWGGDPGFEDWPGNLVDPYGDFSVGRWLWWLTDVERVYAAGPSRGQQRLWDWPAETDR